MKIALSQLDIKDIADKIVADRKLVYRSGENACADDTADDTDFVDGISAKHILGAASAEDRNTAKNAAMLGGKPASDYLSVTASSDIVKNLEGIRKAFGYDVDDLKDEIYQLKRRLTENGYVLNTESYSGRFAGMKDGLGRDVGIIAFANCLSGAEDSIYVNSLEEYEKFDQYDFICVTNPLNKKFNIRQVVKKEDRHYRLVLDSVLSPDVLCEQAELSKTKGFVHEGCFKFANKTEMQPGDKEHHSGLSDDTYRVIRKINSTDKGIGYSFRIPENKQGYITQFEICARAHGNPGELVCYIIDERDVDKFRNPGQAKHDAEKFEAYGDETGFKFFLKSKPYLLTEDKGRRYVKFDFQKIDGTYPLPATDEFNMPVRYVAIIESYEADEGNYYDVVFLQHKSGEEFGDLEFNNTTYEYTAKPAESYSPALRSNKEINSADLYYHVITRSIIASRPDPVRQGLYTDHYEYFKAGKDVSATKLRLMMRIRREGIFSADVGGDETVMNGSPITIRSHGNSNLDAAKLISNIYRPAQLGTESKVERIKTVLGRNIIIVEGNDGHSITVKKPVLVRDDDKLYPVRYIVSVKCKNVEMTTNGRIVESEPETILMPLVEVFRNEDDDGKFSDRLLFEASIEDARLKKYNDFEVQVFWENQEMSEYEEAKNASMGAMKDFVFSVMNTESTQIRGLEDKK